MTSSYKFREKIIIRNLFKGNFPDQSKIGCSSRMTFGSFPHSLFSIHHALLTGAVLGRANKRLLTQQTKKSRETVEAWNF